MGKLKTVICWDFIPGLPHHRPQLLWVDPHWGRGCNMVQKKDTVEEKLLEIILEPECKPDEEELFCLSLAAKLRKIKDPKKREYAQLQLQQTLYNCMYGDAPQPQPQLQPQFPTLMDHQQSSSSSGLQSSNYTMSSDGSTFTLFDLMVKYWFYVRICLFRLVTNWKCKYIWNIKSYLTKDSQC